MSLLSAFITGCSGETLSRDEWAYVQDARPAGLILFDRNCRGADQVRALVNQFKDALGRDRTLIMIDQEGGRVQRMKPPVWRQLPAAETIGALFRDSPGRGVRLARLIAQLNGADLAAHGINMNCAPVLDIRTPNTTKAIGDRSYGGDVASVTTLGRAVAEGLISAGVAPVIKHLPGHGRAVVDSHHELPFIEASLDELRATDFAPFRELADMPAAMTGHVVLNAVDPHEPASASARVIEAIIRGEIGFDGLLISDDLGMRALSGSAAERARSVLNAGCDLALHCNATLAERIEVADVVPLLEGRSLERYQACFLAKQGGEEIDVEMAVAALDEALAAGRATGTVSS